MKRATRCSQSQKNHTKNEKGERWKLSSSTWKLSQVALESLSCSVSVADTQCTFYHFSHRRARATVCQLKVVAQSLSQSTKLMSVRGEWGDWADWLDEYKRYERKCLTNCSEMCGEGKVSLQADVWQLWPLIRVCTAMSSGWHMMNVLHCRYVCRYVLAAWYLMGSTARQAPPTSCNA